MLLILVFILVLNIVAIALTYYCLSDIEKKEKIIFIAIGIAVIYVLTSFVYWISTKNIAIKAVSETGKNLITFLFVPINGIVVLPILAKSYAKYKIGNLKIDKLRNRGIVLAIILVILLAIECAYFKDIQNKVVTMIEENQKIQQEKEKSTPSIVNMMANEQENEMINTIENELQDNMILNNEIMNTENEIQENQITNEVVNQINTIGD